VGTVGSGPPLLIAPSWISHLELDWNLGRDFWERLASHHLLVRYDKRGSGLSDRGVGDYSPQAHVRDLEAIIDALGLSGVALLGTSQGGPICITYAVRHPDKVSHLIILGGFHNGQTAFFRDLVEAFIALIRADWGGFGAASMLDVFMADAPPELRIIAAEYQRQAATAEDAAATWLTVFDFNVTDVLPEVKAPTLVLHRRGDRAVPFQQGREIAAIIPGARFVPLEGDIHTIHFGDTEPLIAAIEQFLLGPEAPRAARRVAESLQTILFTDMVGSTSLTQRIGDAKAQEVLRIHNRIIRGALQLHGGREVKHTGDGLLASFPAATRGLHCAVAVQRALAEHNRANPETPIHVRVGLNAGEPVAEDGDVFGTAVQLAARVCAEAESGQILAADVVQQLAAGKGFVFTDKGKVPLKGFKKRVRLYEVRWREENA
jgi:class 3 adenylate cyclase/pimeloyl-ACP methyl ester carboxylesterase